MSQFAEVAVSVALRRTFTYEIPQALRARTLPGTRVLVPFGRKVLSGFVVRTTEAPPDGSFRVRAIRDLPASEVVLPADLVELAAWVAHRYFTAPGEVFQALLPAGSQAGALQHAELTPRARTLVEGGLRVPNLNRNEERVLEALADRGRRVSVSALASETGVRGLSAILEGLAESGWVTVDCQTERPKVGRKKLLGIRAVSREGAPACPQTAGRERLLSLLAKGGQWMPLQEALRAAGATASAVRSLARAGLVEVAEMTVDRRPVELAAPAEAVVPILTAGQQAALDELRAMIAGPCARRCLLHGVTGSGKTEIYLRLIEEVVRRGDHALLLVPEIGLTPLLSQLVASRFPGLVAMYHSGLAPGERLDQWLQARSGRTPVVVGTRSAVFAPLERLRLIIIDEEQDGSYKQSETPCYHAREVAWRRMHKSAGLLLMGSATPSIETYQQATSLQEIGCLCLPERIEARPLAEAEVVDMNLEFQRHGRKAIVSERLIDELAACLRRREQAIVLLNRRGYSRSLLCRSCGHTVTCPNCSISLTYHQEERRLLCHYCGVEKETPETCPECGGKYIYFVGVGTEQLEEILRTRLPTARMARVDRDSTRRRGSLRTVLLDFAEGRLDVLVGTQLVAKGHDFPNVTLVGVVCADAGLGLPDFRSAERTFQLLTQVAGRAGRGQSPGRVIIQAHYPDHYALRFARNQDYQGFFAQEIEFRRLMSYPPFTSLAQILITHRDQETGFRIGESIGAALKYQAGELSLDPRPRILGPAAAPIEKLKGSYRIQLLIKAAEPEGAVRLLQAAFEQLGRQRIPLSAVQVDVDPLSLM